MLSQILIGIFTSVFSSVLEKSWSSATIVDVEDVVEQVMQGTAAEVVERDPGCAVEFLSCPEATTFVRMLFMAQVHGPDISSDELRSTFASTYQRHEPRVSDAEADALFVLLAAGTERILEEAAREGNSEASEALAAVRFRHLKEEVQGLRHSIAALGSTQEIEVETYLAWEKTYREQVMVRHGTITPPSFDAVERVPVSDIFIEPWFRATREADSRELHLTREDLTRRLDRTVVLGDPGAGKSTFAMKLAYDLAHDQATLAGGSLTPLIVTLKDYGAEKAATRISLVEWIESTISTDYSVPAPEGAVPYLLAAGRVVVILDGLDELLDSSYRREITADIETFAARYVAAPILVTSRRIGYPQAPLDRRRFDIAYLAELDSDQIRKYVEMWFGLRKELTEGERSQMAADFMRDSAGAADDLRSNTLMLALLCNIYRGDGYIPRQRPQVYEKCAVMLFERWDRGRRIEVTLEFERHLRPAMQHLAFWIYSQPALRGGVTESELIRATTTYLLGRRFDDEDATRQEARRFVEFCRGRAWVFTDTGTTADGEPLYQFTHRTFLEFFAAEHLVRTNATPSELGDVLRPRVQRGEWDVVAQLAFQLQDDNIDGAADELLGGLLADPGVEEAEDASLSFAARSLAFLVPRRATCRAIAKAVSSRTYQWLRTYSEEPEMPWSEEGSPKTLPSEAFSALANSDRENFDPISETVIEEMVAAVEADPSCEGAEAALEIAANTDMAVRPPSPRKEAWQAVEAEAFGRLWPHLHTHVGESERIAFDGVYFGVIELNEALQARNAGFIFDARRFKLYDGYLRSSIGEFFLWGALGQMTRIGGEALGTQAELESLGEILRKAKPPWDRSEISVSGLEHNFLPGKITPTDPDLEGNSLFAAFALLAAVSEYMEHDSEYGVMVDGLREATGWPNLLLPWIERRYDSADAELPELPMDAELRGLAESWGTKAWSAIKREPMWHGGEEE